MNKRDLGAVSAYAMAKEKGYEGTENEFATLMAESGDNALRAEAAKERAEEILGSIPQEYTELSQNVVKNTGDITTLSQDIEEETNRAKTEEARIERMFADGVDAAVDNWLESHPEATTTVKDGSLGTSKFTDDAKLHVLKDYATPQMFGAVGDGVADDTDAFMAAYATGKPIYVEGCRISDCHVENTKIVAKNMHIVGLMSIRNVEMTGTAIVNGGSILIANEDSGHPRDDSNIHDFVFDIENCGTLLTMEGTLYNARVHNVTVKGRCTNHVIHLKTSTWLTSILISHCFLGICNTPILLEDNTENGTYLADISILYTTAQRIDNGNECRFITTNSGGALNVIGSHMYDLKNDDAQIYIERNAKIAGKQYSVYWNNYAVAINKNLVKDSTGKTGRALLSDISDKINVQYGAGNFPTMITPKDAFYTVSGSLCYGVSEPICVTGSNFIGTSYKSGTAISANGFEYFVGMDTGNRRLKTMTRYSGAETLVLKTYRADQDEKGVSTKTEIQRYGDGTPLFYVPLKKIVVKWGSFYFDANGTDVTASIAD